MMFLLRLLLSLLAITSVSTFAAPVLMGINFYTGNRGDGLRELAVDNKEQADPIVARLREAGE